MLSGWKFSEGREGIVVKACLIVSLRKMALATSGGSWQTGTGVREGGTTGLQLY